MKIVVLGGGDSPERKISLRSAKAVESALTQAGYETLHIDPIYEASLDTIDSTSIVFPILHGKNGEDGVIQRQLEERNLAYLGSDYQASNICFNKAVAREIFTKNGLIVAQGEKVNRKNYPKSKLAKVPHVLKANLGGSSIGTYIVHDPSIFLTTEIDEVFEYSSEAVLEELVEGVEITIPVLDGKALPVLEIIPPTDEEFDYENKYNGRTQELCPPVSISEKQQQEAQKIAEKAHQITNCRHLSRTDVIVRPNGDMVVLEINTMPGMTDQSLYPKAALTADISFPELMTKFVELVKRDYGL